MHKIVNWILLQLPHKHWSARRDNVGEIHVCHSRNRILVAGFRRDETSQAWEIPIHKLEALTNCESFEEAMALLRSE